MTHAFITIYAPLALEKLDDAEHAIDAMGNPANDDIRKRLDVLKGDNGTHFASMHAIRSQDSQHGWLVLEFSADGDDDEALDRVISAMEERLRTLFTLASDWTDGSDLRAYLAKHKTVPGCGWFSHPGVVFAGTPGLSVGRIRREARLAAHVTDLVGALPGSMSASNRVAAVRRAVENSAFKDALAVATTEPPFSERSTAEIAGVLAGSFVTTYLWPLGLVLIAAALLGGMFCAAGEPFFWPALAAFLHGAVSVTIKAAFALFVLLVIAIGVVYAQLRKQEDQDWVENRAPHRKTAAAMFERENRCAQNHMVSITRRKPGIVRWFTSLLIFWAVGTFASKIYRPGFLSDICTIHFARWVTLPGSRDVLFFSNYDSSWESYLEDFITRAHTGLTGIWSNSIGFPKSENLVQKGATDGERFKRYARASMIPTRFWYSAYPTLTTTGIRTSTEIRRGLSGVMTEDEAIRWLALFGSAPRPESKLVNNEIQSLLFGGLKFMPCGVCLLFRLPDDVGTARTWLREVYPFVAFNDGHRLAAEAVVTLALGASGLRRLGLAEEGLATFPFAFLEGMTPEYRARILGDKPDVDGPWVWDDRNFDAALLVYGKTPEALAELENKLRRLAAEAGMDPGHTIPLVELSDDKTEPFGFVDGISQPVIRGTYKALRNGDSIHIVEPGEFILGYPDNRGNLPPGPTLPALADPDNMLPLCDRRDDFAQTQVEDLRDLGKNGSFLVIRQLEQNKGGFWKYCNDEAEAMRLKDRLSPPYTMTAEFIGAKLIGRWPGGSSLVRHPYSPPGQEKEATKETVRPQAKTSYASSPVASAPPKVVGRPGNDFLFGTEDPEGMRCPFGAHIRRANPRDSLDPGSADEISIVNRHRIMRVGRQYVPGDGADPGILFMCLNGDIERQFEFVQQTWLKRPSFHGLTCEKDPLLGDGEHGACGFTIPSRDGPILLNPMPAFVKTRGGGYFFLPGKRLIEFLAQMRR
jgi:deferrochelatase/peroxidase EfeB